MLIHSYPTDMALEDVYMDMANTSSLLAADPRTRHLANALKEAMDDTDAAMQEERKLALAVVNSGAVLRYAGYQLDDVNLDVKQTVLRLIKEDRDNPLYQYFYRKHTPSRLKGLTLDDKINAMENWGDAIKDAEQPELRALNGPLQDGLKNAENATANHQATTSALNFFLKLGTKPKTIQRANHARLTLAETLRRLRADHPELELKKGFERRFFKTRRPRKVRRKQLISQLRQRATQFIERADKLEAEEQAEIEANLQGEETKRAEIIAKKRRQAKELNAEIAQLEGREPEAPSDEPSEDQAS